MMQTQSQRKFSIILHGGAGNFPKTNNYTPMRNALSKIIYMAYDYASDTSHNAVDIVEYVVSLLEDCPFFNAGRGAVYNDADEHELEASIMDGARFRSGGATLLKYVKNPIKLARCVMERTDHLLLGGEGAEAFARSCGLEIVDQQYFHTELRKNELNMIRGLKFKSLHSRTLEVTQGTVGCVVFVDGELAAGTSTGGRTNKMKGRMGDSAIIGAGTWAKNSTCAVSCTGIGEEFMKTCMGFSISSMMEFMNIPLSEAVRIGVHQRLPDNVGGVIAVDAYGNIVHGMNSSGMLRASCTNTGSFKIGIWEDEDAIERDLITLENCY